MDVLYKNQGKSDPLRVFVDNTQGGEGLEIKRGTALSYDFAWAGELIDGTIISASSQFPGRCQIVRLPNSGDKTFAGVATRDYKIPAGKGGWILIDASGSVALVRTLVNCTAGTTAICYTHASGVKGTFKAAATAKGKGTAIAMQTLNPGGSETLVQVYLEQGATASPVS